MVRIVFTVFFEDPFWVGVWEREWETRYSAAKATFGAQPSDAEVWAFVLERYGELVFSGRESCGAGSVTAGNPKRMQREAARAVIDFAFEEFDIAQVVAGARVANPASRNVLEKCGFQWTGVELHRFEALGGSTPVDRFRLSRGVWSSLKSWNATTRRAS